MTDEEYPRVSFRFMRGTLMYTALGYLSIIDGVPYVAETLEDAKGRRPAMMFRLDPEHLEERHDDVTGEQYFLYRPVFRS